MLKIFVTYNDPEQVKSLEDMNLSGLKLIDALTTKGKKEAWRVKSHYSAKLDPFAVVLKGDKPVRAFYTEAEDAINALIKYLKNEFARTGEGEAAND